MLNEKLTSVFSSDYRKTQFEEPILEVGRTALSRQDMYDLLHNGHTTAARKVSGTLKRLGVTTPAQILKVPMIDWARISGFGEASLRILLDLLLYNNYSISEIQGWITAGLRGQKLVQWESICRQAAKTGKKRRHAV